MSDDIKVYVYQFQTDYPEQIPELRLETTTLKLQNVYYHLQMTDCMVMYTQIPFTLEDKANNAPKRPTY